MDNINDKYQLEQIRPGMPYEELVKAAKRNFSILLNAYISGANVVQFTGSPGVSGNAGQRGSGMFVISDQCLYKAMEVYVGSMSPITEDNVLQSITNTQVAITNILMQEASTKELMANISLINSRDDFVMYDTLLFSNGFMLTTTYTDNNGSRTFNVTGNVLTFNNATQLNIDEIVQEVLNQVDIKANPLTSQASTAKSFQYGGSFRTAYLPKSVQPTEASLTTMAFLAANTAAGSAVAGIDNVVLVAGTDKQLKQIYSALNIALDDTAVDSDAKANMPIEHFQPSLLIAQTAHGEHSSEPANLAIPMSLPNQRYGLTIVDMDTIAADADGNATDGISWTKFATIAKYADGLWIMSQSDTDKYGKVYLSKTRYELMLNGIYRLETENLQQTVHTYASFVNDGSAYVKIDGKTTLQLGEIYLQSNDDIEAELLSKNVYLHSSSDNFDIALMTSKGSDVFSLKYGNEEGNFIVNIALDAYTTIDLANELHATYAGQVVRRFIEDVTERHDGNSHSHTYSNKGYTNVNLSNDLTVNVYGVDPESKQQGAVSDSYTTGAESVARNIVRQTLANGQITQTNRLEFNFDSDANASNDKLSLKMQSGAAEIIMPATTATFGKFNLGTQDFQVTASGIFGLSSKYMQIATATDGSSTNIKVNTPVAETIAGQYNINAGLGQHTYNGQYGLQAYHITLTALQGGMLVQSGSTTDIESAGAVTIKNTAGDMTLSSEAGKVIVHADNELSMQGQQGFDLFGNASSKIRSNGDIAIGATANLNATADTYNITAGKAMHQAFGKSNQLEYLTIDVTTTTDANNTGNNKSEINVTGTKNSSAKITLSNLSLSLTNLEVTVTGAAQEGDWSYPAFDDHGVMHYLNEVDFGKTFSHYLELPSNFVPKQYQGEIPMYEGGTKYDDAFAIIAGKFFQLGTIEDGYLTSGQWVNDGANKNWSNQTMIFATGVQQDAYLQFRDFNSSIKITAGSITLSHLEQSSTTLSSTPIVTITDALLSISKWTGITPSDALALRYARGEPSLGINVHTRIYDDTDIHANLYVGKTITMNALAYNARTLVSGTNQLTAYDGFVTKYSDTNVVARLPNVADIQIGQILYFTNSGRNGYDISVYDTLNDDIMEGNSHNVTTRSVGEFGKMCMLIYLGSVNWTNSSGTVTDTKKTWQLIRLN